MSFTVTPQSRLRTRRIESPCDATVTDALAFEAHVWIGDNVPIPVASLAPARAHNDACKRVVVVDHFEQRLTNPPTASPLVFDQDESDPKHSPEVRSVQPRRCAKQCSPKATGTLIEESSHTHRQATRRTDYVVIAAFEHHAYRQIWRGPRSLDRAD
jgi:hypothetical protein